jgi:hypothetical protein
MQTSTRTSKDLVAQKVITKEALIKSGPTCSSPALSPDPAHQVVPRPLTSVAPADRRHLEVPRARRAMPIGVSWVWNRATGSASALDQFCRDGVAVRIDEHHSSASTEARAINARFRARRVGPRHRPS